MKFELNLSAQPFAAIMRSDSVLANRISEDSQNWMTLLGRIYGESNPDLNDLLTRLESPDSAIALSGRFVFVHVEKKSGRLRIWTDKYRSLGAAIAQRAPGTRISNFELPPSGENRFSAVDCGSLCDLLELGYVLPPRTLYKNSRMLAGFTETGIGATIDETKQIDWRAFWPRPRGAANPGRSAEFFDKFREVANRLVKTWKPIRFRISAGVDTRFLCACLSKESIDQLEFDVVCAPYLNEQTDRDVIGAKMLAEVLGVPLSVLHMPPKTSAYFAELPGGLPALTGLYGGEFLGGVMFGDGPSVATASNRFLADADFLRIEPEFRADSRRRFAADLNQYGNAALLTSVYLGAFRSSIYESVHLSWASPSQLGLAALSPYAEPEVLDFILSQPESVLRGYGFYGELIRRYLPERFRSIPLSSPILSFHSDLPEFTFGRDPKFRPHVSEEPAQPLRASFAAEMARLGIRIENPNTLLKKRLLNLQNALGY